MKESTRNKRELQMKMHTQELMPIIYVRHFYQIVLFYWMSSLVEFLNRKFSIHISRRKEK